MTDTLLLALIEAGIRFVSIHPRSEKDIRAYLLKKLRRYHNEDESYIEQAFERLSELGYVDDKAYSQAFVASRNAHNQKGNTLLRLELRAKGIAPHIIDEVLESMTTGDEGTSEYTRAMQLVEKKKNVFNLPILERKRKIFSYLSRRGFGSDTIRRVIDGDRENDYNT